MLSKMIFASSHHFMVKREIQREGNLTDSFPVVTYWFSRAAHNNSNTYSLQKCFILKWATVKASALAALDFHCIYKLSHNWAATLLLWKPSLSRSVGKLENRLFCEKLTSLKHHPPFSLGPRWLLWEQEQ